MVGEGWDNALTKLFSTRGGVFWEFCRDKSDEPELFAEPPIWKEKNMFEFGEEKIYTATNFSPFDFLFWYEVFMIWYLASNTKTLN